KIFKSSGFTVMAKNVNTATNFSPILNSRRRYPTFEPLFSSAQCVKLPARTASDMYRQRLIISLFLICFTSSVAHATTVERLDLHDLVRKAHKIIVGRVSNSRTFWSSNRKLILTSYTVEVHETIKGESSHTLELTTIGGTIGDLTLHVA